MSIPPKLPDGRPTAGSATAVATLAPVFFIDFLHFSDQGDVFRPKSAPHILYFLRYAELCASRARIFFKLDITWQYRLSRQHIYLRLSSANTYWKASRTIASTCQISVGLLYYSVLKGVKGDYGNSSLGIQDRDRVAYRWLNSVKLGVYLYSDSLEGSLAGCGPSARFAAGIADLIMSDSS